MDQEGRPTRVCLKRTPTWMFRSKVWNYAEIFGAVVFLKHQWTDASECSNSLFLEHQWTPLNG